MSLVTAEQLFQSELFGFVPESDLRALESLGSHGVPVIERHPKRTHFEPRKPLSKPQAMETNGK